MLFCPDYVMKSSQGSEVMSVPAQGELESSSHTVNTFGNYKMIFFVVVFTDCNSFRVFCMMDFNIFGDFYSEDKEHQILKFPVKWTHCTSLVAFFKNSNILLYRSILLSRFQWDVFILDIFTNSVV